jgi:excisionase family DNA binding protein
MNWGGGADMNKSNNDLTKNAKPDFEPILTAEEAAVHLRIHTKTLQKLARLGQVPCMRRGKYWFFRLSSLDVWLRALENRGSQPFCVK